MKVLTVALLLVTLQCSHALSPANCDASEPSAEKVLDLINKGRRDGYAFQLLRVSDAHVDQVGDASVYYFILDVKESDCWVLSTKSQDSCLEADAKWPSEIVIGQCKVIATRYSNESQDFRVNNYNCTTSSVSSALSNTKDSPVLLDFFEDPEVYREQANQTLDKYKEENVDFASFRVDRVQRAIRARGGDRTNYYLDFSVRNCSTQHFPRYPPVFGFCRAVLSYNVEASNLKAPENTGIKCEVFNFEDRNKSDVKPHWDREHSPCGKDMCKFGESRGHHHTHMSLPMDIIHMDTTLMDINPMDMLLMDTIPMDTILMDVILMDTLLMDTILLDTDPMDMISMTMDPVTHPPIAKNSKGSIIGAMAHHMATQEKEAQVSALIHCTKLCNALEMCSALPRSSQRQTSRLLPSLTQEETSQEINCNDEDVFQAVDAALKKYNAGIQTGNQFVLYRVTEGTKMVGSETFYSFKYEIKESNCSVQSGLSWQDCYYKDAQEAASGECTTTVRKRGSNKFTVATQTCKITPVEDLTANYTCLGCVYPISTDDPDLKPILKHAIEHFNNNTHHSHLFALEEVKKAQRQVVAGLNFEITYSIVQTNCSKEHFLRLSPECKSLLNGDVGECRDNAFVDMNGKIADFSQNCGVYPGEDLSQLLPENCAGCPKDIPVDSPELTEALGHAITKLNTENNHSFYFKIGTVKKARSQVVGGMKYFMEFIARETECSKDSNTELKANCEAKPAGQNLNCKANVYMRPWENKVESTVNCEALDMMSMIRRPPGFSPFRSVQVKETKDGKTRLLNSCEYKGRPSGAGAESAPGSEAASPHLAQ
ncbi:kininogen-1 isoform X2 [Sigmodon hispidus]